MRFTPRLFSAAFKALTALSLLALSACAGLDGPTRITLSQADLQALLQRNFPIDKRVLEVFEVKALAPELRLLPERNRLAAVAQVQVRERLRDSAWTGRLHFDTALRWEPSDQSVRLTQVRVRELVVDDAGTGQRRSADRLGAVLAERLLEDLSVYRLSPERQAKLIKLGAQPSAITVTSRGVEITFDAGTR